MARAENRSSCFWLLLLPLSVVWTQVEALSPVSQLVAVSVSLLLMIKLITERDFILRHPQNLRFRDRLAWYALWPGLDARAFFVRGEAKTNCSLEWTCAVSKFALGVVLLCGVAPRCLVINDLLAGWVAMTGLIFVFHFGSFHLAALVWRRMGRDITPIMHMPVAATSLSEFWSKRWNLAFRDFAHRFVFKPVVQMRHPQLASWAVFVFSGLVHELAISMPAKGGYGLPFAYFALQGCGVWLERHIPSLTDGRHPIRGWLFTVAFTTPAAFWLFHPAFVRRLILPLIGS